MADSNELERVELYVSALLEEYKTIRDESKQASINMLLILQIGAGIMGALLLAASREWAFATGVAALILLVLIPLLSAVSMFMWLGEARRFKRAGDYLCMLERKATTAMSEVLPSAIRQEWPMRQLLLESKLNFKPAGPLCGALAWEQWLRLSRPQGGSLRGSGHDELLYAIRLMFFPSIVVVSVLMGVLQLKVYPTPVFGDYWRVLVVVGALTIASCIVIGWPIAQALRRPVDLPPET